MTGLMQRIFRRRASGSPRRGVAGLLRRLPSGRRRVPAGGRRMPWGRRAARPGAVEEATTGVHDASVVVHQGPGSQTSFRDRGNLRRRLRFLRRARELAFRDIGGLMFDMRRFGRERPDLVEAKLAALAAVDRELRALETVLGDKRPLHELREPGITSCARCGALHASDSNFCPNCGLQIGGPRAMGEVGGSIAAPPQPPPAPLEQPTSPTIAGGDRAPGAPAPPPGGGSTPAAASSAPPPQAPAPSAPAAPSSQPTETWLPPSTPDDRP